MSLSMVRPGSRAQERSSVAIRPLALPNEHGGWGFILEPIVLGLLVAPSSAGLLMGIGVLAAFLTRHPLKLAAADWLRRRMYPRTKICLLLSLGYGTTAIALIVAALALGPHIAMLPLVAGALPAAIQFGFDARNKGREMLAEVAGSLASASVAAAIVIAGGGSAWIALALSALTAARAIPTILFVRSALRGGSHIRSLAAHGAGILVAAALFTAGLAPGAAIVAMCILLVRAALTRPATPAKTIGLRELAYGAAFVLTVGLTY